MVFLSGGERGFCCVWRCVQMFGRFGSMVGQVCLLGLQLGGANASDTEAAFLDSHLSTSNDSVSTRVYDKRGSFGFWVVNFPFLDGDVPRSASCGVCVSQLIRSAGASSYVAGFSARNELLTHFLNKAIGIINFAKPFLNFIDDTMV